MRITKTFRTDQETIKRFLDVLGGGSVVLGKNNLAAPVSLSLRTTSSTNTLSRVSLKRKNFS